MTVARLLAMIGAALWLAVPWTTPWAVAECIGWDAGTLLVAAMLISVADWRP